MRMFCCGGERVQHTNSILLLLLFLFLLVAIHAHSRIIALEKELDSSHQQTKQLKEAVNARADKFEQMTTKYTNDLHVHESKIHDLERMANSSGIGSRLSGRSGSEEEEEEEEEE